MARGRDEWPCGWLWHKPVVAKSSCSLRIVYVLEDDGRFHRHQHRDAHTRHGWQTQRACLPSTATPQHHEHHQHHHYQHHHHLHLDNAGPQPARPRMGFWGQKTVRAGTYRFAPPALSSGWLVVHKWTNNWSVMHENKRLTEILH